MEEQLRQNLLTCANAYVDAANKAGRKLQISTLGKIMAKDSKFFERVGDESTSFTVRKYDEVIEWFSSHWPDDVAWPANVERPPVLEREDVA